MTATVMIQLTEEQAKRLRSEFWSHIMKQNANEESIRFVRELMQIYFAIGGQAN